MVESKKGLIDRLDLFIDEDRMAGKTDANKKSYERKHYRATKHKKKSSKERLERSSEGKKRKKREEGNPDRTPTGKPKTRYHV